jgi:regulatory protein
LEQTELGNSIITRVEKQKKYKHRYHIFINEEYAFSVHEDTMIKHRLFKGELIQPDRMLHILQDEERHKAYSKAMRMIGRRPHSTQEIKRKLKEQAFEDDIIGWTLDKLKQQNYLNDEDFAKVLTENRIYSQHKGRNYVRQELQQRGVSRELIQEAMNHINPEEEYHGALTLAQKKWKLTNGSTLDKRRKTLTFLMRKGYTGSVVNQVMQEVANGFEDDEEISELEDELFD